jgi:hypothetical protein
MLELLHLQKTGIIEAYTAIFTYSDAHEWNKVKLFLDDILTVDYSSLNGQPAALISREDLIAAWSAFLPRFTFTMHFLSNHHVFVQGEGATASCYGHAIHQLQGAEGGDFWEVYGSYNFSLRRAADAWLVTSIRYNHRYAGGNLNLPVIASR